MKTRTKVLGLMMAAVLLVSATIFGTMAYLTDKDTVTNTFTVGNVAITLDEAEVNPDGTKKNENRVTANTYHLLPGHEYIKDPTIKVASGSEDCWLFVKVENGISAIEDSSNTIAKQLGTNGWAPVAEGSNVYCRTTTNKANDEVTVFENFKVSGTADISGYANAQIIVTAYAVQADGFDTAVAAWEASFGKA